VETCLCGPNCNGYLLVILGGLLFKMSDSNMQYVTSTSFLLLTYAKYLTSAHTIVNCGGIAVTPKRLRSIAKKQVGKKEKNTLIWMWFFICLFLICIYAIWILFVQEFFFDKICGMHGLKTLHFFQFIITEAQVINI